MAETVTYYFNSYDVGTAWSNNPAFMADGDEETIATTTTDTDEELLNANTCIGTDLGTITKVEIRAWGSVSVGSSSVSLTPYFSDLAGDAHNSGIDTEEGWNAWVDITSDTNAPVGWSWSDISNLDCLVIFSQDFSGASVAKVEIQVTYIPNGPGNLKKCFGVEKASIKKIVEIETANIKKISGIA